MKSDAMASSYFSRLKIDAGRMDRAMGKDQSFSAPGFGSAQGRTGEADEGFHAVYAKIATTNAQAFHITNASTHAKSAGRKVDLDQKEDVHDHRLHENAQLPEATPKPPSAGDQTDPDVLAAQASQLPAELQAILADNSAGGDQDSDPAAAEASTVISQALQALSEGLHLTIDPDLKQLSLSKPSKDTVQQLSEILCALKKVAGLLDGAVAQNQQLDTGSGVIDVAESQKLSELVHTQMFRIEIGVSMLGVADQVSGEVAQKLALPFSGDIPQASDPSQMSNPQAKKIFDGVLGESSKDLSQLVEKIKDLCAENSQPAANVTAQTVAQAAQGTATNGGVSPFDAQTMRQMLNIDGKQLTAGENAEAAAQDGKVALPVAVAREVAKNLTADAVKSAEELVTIGDATAKAAGEQTVVGAEAKTATTASRALDESVMKQLAEKIQTVTRAGVTELRIQMRPESLGEVKLRIRIEGDVVFTKIQVESEQVKNIIESNLQQLKDSLSLQHLQAGSLEVSVGNGDGNGHDGQMHEGSAADGRMTAEAVGASGSADEALSPSLGSETGRRFGENTVEYFA